MNFPRSKKWLPAAVIAASLAAPDGRAKETPQEDLAQMRRVVAMRILEEVDGHVAEKVPLAKTGWVCVGVLGNELEALHEAIVGSRHVFKELFGYLPQNPMSYSMSGEAYGSGVACARVWDEKDLL